MGLIILVGIFQSWNIALSIFNLCLISAVMTMGANIQWGYAGLINFGIMGFTALGGLAAVLISVDPVQEAWSAGGSNILFSLFLIIAMVLAVRYILKNLPWAFSFLQNCKKNRVEYIATALANFLSHSRLTYDQLFKEVDVSQYINNNEQYNTNNQQYTNNNKQYINNNQQHNNNDQHYIKNNYSITITTKNTTITTKNTRIQQ